MMKRFTRNWITLVRHKAVFRGVTFQHLTLHNATSDSATSDSATSDNATSKSPSRVRRRIADQRFSLAKMLMGRQ